MTESLILYVVETMCSDGALSQGVNMKFVEIFFLGIILSISPCASASSHADHSLNKYDETVVAARGAVIAAQEAIARYDYRRGIFEKLVAEYKVDLDLATANGTYEKLKAGFEQRLRLIRSEGRYLERRSRQIAYAADALKEDVAELERLKALPRVRN